MKILTLFLVFLMTLSVFVACGDDDGSDIVCKNRCSQEEHAKTRCKSDTVLETCTHLGGSCYSWVAKTCESPAPVCKDEDNTPASCVVDGF